MDIYSQNIPVCWYCKYSIAVVYEFIYFNYGLRYNLYVLLVSTFTIFSRPHVLFSDSTNLQFESRNILMMDLFLLSSLDYLWIIVMFLSAVWTLILTAPIHYKGSIGE